MKWITLLKKYKSHEAGAKIQISDEMADFLVERGDAELSANPNADVIAEATAANAAQMKSIVDESVKAAVKEIAASTKASLKEHGSIKVGDPNAADDPKCGYADSGEFARSIVNWAVSKKMDERFVLPDIAAKKSLMKSGATKAATTYSSEALGADGGVLVPPEFTRDLLKYTFNAQAIAPMCRQILTAGNQITIPKDETVPWGTDGTQAYWTQQGGTITQSKVKLGEVNVQLSKLAALCPVTNEQLDDGFLNLGSYLMENVPPKIRDKVDGAIYNGTGVGQPLGFSNAGAVLTATIATGGSGSGGNGSATNIVQYDDVIKMLSLLQTGSTQAGGTAWLVHSTTIPSLMQLTIGNYPVVTAIGAGVGGATDPALPLKLLGHPIIITEQAQPVGTKGDISLVNMKNYILATKTNDPKMDMSVHLYFDQDITTFRFIFRVGGLPWMSAPITQKNGGGQLGAFIQLSSTLR